MKRTAFVVATCVATGLVGVSCGASDPGGRDPDDDGPQVGEAFVVGAEGGVFTLEDGFAIEVPPGAVSATTDLTVERIEETREGALGPMYVLGPEGQTFHVPVTLTLPITAELELGENAILDAYGFTAPTGSDDFTRLERHDPAEGAVITETTHFSVFYAGMSPPVVLAQQHAYPTAIAMDADYLYFASGGTEATLPADTNDGYIHRVRRGTSEPEAMTPAEPDPTALWVGDSHVYWASGGDDDPVIPSAIKRVDKATLEIETLVETGDLLSILGDGSFIYFGDGANGNIYKMPLDGGVPEVLASDAGSPEHLAQDAETIYWTGGASTNRVYKVAKAGGTVTVIAENEAEPAGIAVDAEFVYWANTGDGAVFKAPITGGEKTLIHQGGSMVGLAIRGSTLFSTDVTLSGSVNAHDLVSHATTVLALDQPFAWRIIAPEGRDVFWSNVGNYRYEGQIMSYTAP